jgi:hypothetical protein
MKIRPGKTKGPAADFERSGLHGDRRALSSQDVCCNFYCFLLVYLVSIHSGRWFFEYGTPGTPASRSNIGSRARVLCHVIGVHAQAGREGLAQC